MIDAIISLLKYLSILLTACSGIYALFVSYKDGSGNITRAGKHALALIVCSALIAIGSHSLELIRGYREKQSTSDRRAQDTLEAVRRTEKTLFEINRGLQLLNTIYVRFEVDVPLEDVRLATYATRFNNQLAGLLPALERREAGIEDVYISHRNKQGPQAVTFSAKSSLAPRKAEEPIPFFVLGHMEVSLEFYKYPIEPERHPGMIDFSVAKTPADLALIEKDLKSGDLGFEVDSSASPSSNREMHNFHFRLSTKKLSVSSPSIRVNNEYVRSSGEIVSVADLPGSQLFLMLRSPIVSGKIEVDEPLFEVRKKLTLDSVTLRVANGREFQLNSKDMTKLMTPAGFPMYVFYWPKTTAELATMSR